MKPNDIATVEHWESVWKNTSRVQPTSRWNYYDHVLAKLFDAVSSRGSRVLEIGCGSSRWIGYFAGERNCETWGIDYSPEGIRLAAEANRSAGKRLTLVEGDFFDTSTLPAEHFDFVYSLGFIEHFTEPGIVCARMFESLRPGGVAVTLIPNFVGPYGRLQKAASADIYRKHVVMDPATLDGHHVEAGLALEVPARYFGCFGPGVVNFDRWQTLAMVAVKPVQHAVCWALHLVRADVDSRLLSPYIVGIYRKPELKS